MNLLPFRWSRSRYPAPPGFADYRMATRHPVPCLVFLLPLLAAYEIGIWQTGGEALRNGADSWLRWGLESFGLPQLFWAPVLIAGWFLFLSWWRLDDMPDDVPGVCVGMAIESLAFGLGLWVVSRSVGPLADLLRLALAPADTTVDLSLVVTYVGAGIYEEVIFRLALYSGLVVGLRMLQLSARPALVLAAAASALLFAGAHHVGPYGEPFNDYVFLFRALAGLYFAALYQVRGFGIAVGAHIFYDVLVGVGLSGR